MTSIARGWHQLQPSPRPWWARSGGIWYPGSENVLGHNPNEVLPKRLHILRRSISPPHKPKWIPQRTLSGQWKRHMGYGAELAFTFEKRGKRHSTGVSQSSGDGIISGEHIGKTLDMQAYQLFRTNHLRTQWLHGTSREQRCMRLVHPPPKSRVRVPLH